MLVHPVDDWRLAQLTYLLTSILSIKPISSLLVSMMFLSSLLTLANFRFWTSGFGVITSPAVENGFRLVDRKFFVPKVSLVMSWRKNRSDVSHQLVLRFAKALHMLINPWKRATSTSLPLISTDLLWKLSTYATTLPCPSWTLAQAQVTCPQLWPPSWDQNLRTLVWKYTKMWYSIPRRPLTCGSLP